MNVWVYDVETDEGSINYVSFLAPALIEKRGGLRPEMILGSLPGDSPELSPEKFSPNPVFIRFLHFVIFKHGRNCPGLLAEARRQQDGWVYISDARLGQWEEKIPLEDMIGAFEVKGGQLVRYQPNEGHQLFTEKGFVKLDGWFFERLVEEVISLG